MKTRTRQTPPDAWMQLVFSTMSVADLREVLADESDAQKRDWIRAELLKRNAR